MSMLYPHNIFLKLQYVWTNVSVQTIRLKFRLLFLYRFYTKIKKLSEHLLFFVVLIFFSSVVVKFITPDLRLSLNHIEFWSSFPPAPNYWPPQYPLQLRQLAAVPHLHSHSEH